MASELAGKKCVPCSEKTPPLKGQAIKNMEQKLGGGWKVINEDHLEKEFKFKDFRETLNFVDRVGEIAEEEGHHPEICFTWGKAKINLSTHKINGLSENDFILAAKVDEAA